MKNEVYKLVENFPEKIKKAYESEVPVLENKYKDIVFIGKGGNYIAGLLLKEILRNEIEVKTELFINNKSLIVLASYSGNTKEVLKTFEKIKNKKNVLVITSGGKLLKIAEKTKINLIKIESGINPRFTFSECFFPVLKCLEKSKIIKSKENIIYRIIRSLKNNSKKIEKNAEHLAKKIHNKIPLFYSSMYFYPASYRMQTIVEEDSKIIGHSNIITEIFHNEIEALPNKKFFPVLIIDNQELESFKSQVIFFKKILDDYYEFKFHNYLREEKMFLIFYFSDFLGFYLSKIKKTKMGITPLTDEIKKLK